MIKASLDTLPINISTNPNTSNLLILFLLCLSTPGPVPLHKLTLWCTLKRLSTKFLNLMTLNPPNLLILKIQNLVSLMIQNLLTLKIQNLLNTQNTMSLNTHGRLSLNTQNLMSPES
jgi:hypothetical protein